MHCHTYTHDPETVGQGVSADGGKQGGTLFFECELVVGTQVTRAMWRCFTNLCVRANASKHVIT